MKWLQRVIIKYKLSIDNKYLIFDPKGILSHPKTLSELQKQGYHTQFINALSQLSTISQTDYKGLIFPTIKDIPAVISRRLNCVTVDSSTMPFDVSAEVFNKLTIDEYIDLIEYLSCEDIHTSVSTSNCSILLDQAYKTSYFIEQEELISGLYNLLADDITYDDLLIAGRILGFLEYNNYKYGLKPFDLPGELKKKIESYILSEKYTYVFYESPNNPKTVDKIIPHIRLQNINKIALIVFDCMGWGEWCLLKEYLHEFEFEEMSLFALIPTITSISRKAIFAAEHMNVYQRNIDESRLLQLSFQDESNICFFNSSSTITEENLIGWKVIAKIYNVFDDIAHGVIIPKSDHSKNLYFTQVRAFLELERIAETFTLLKNQGFTIYVCSDHGNTLAIGNGRKHEKWLIEKSAKRALLTTDSDLLYEMSYRKYKIPFSQKVVMLADDGEMFDNVNAKEIVHGGISLQELVVPFVKLNRK